MQRRLVFFIRFWFQFYPAQYFLLRIVFFLNRQNLQAKRKVKKDICSVPYYTKEIYG